ncbi:MAG: flagellar hook-length control protein FliK [Campylobacterota bacterium]|nr:flagellar hook-length control protein FliK [Campylobacterota bacterium]
MININTNKTLNIILPNTNKALKEVLESSSPKELQALSSGKDLKSIVNDILSQTSKNSSQDKMLLDLVKNNPTFKELGSVISSAKELLSLLKQDKSPLPLEKQLQNLLGNIKDINEKGLQSKIENSGLFLENKLKNIQTPREELRTLTTQLSTTLQDTKLPNLKAINAQLQELLNSDAFKSINSKELLTNVKVDIATLTQLSKSVGTLLDKITQRLDSPLDKSISPKDVLYSKDTQNLLDKLQLLNTPQKLQMQTKLQELFSNDLKSVLHKAQEELTNSNHPNKQELLKHIDKLSLQIDYHQLVSHLSNATSLYIPYSWDALEDGNITMKNLKDGKFFTDIELQLKEYGSLKLRLGMFEENQLNINITAQSSEFKKILQENMSQLRQQLYDVGITPKEIRFLDDKSANAYGGDSSGLALGFEVKA